MIGYKISQREPELVSFSVSSIFYFAICLLLGLCSTQVQGEELYECPKFLAVPTINLQQFMGNWYIHGWIRNTPGVPPFRCLHVHWTSENLINEPLEITEVVHLTSTLTNVTSTENHTAYILNSSAPGKWFVSETGINYDVTIMYTDLDGYSQWAQCSVQNSRVFLQIFFASRHENERFPEELKQQLLQTLKKEYDVDISGIYEVPQGSRLCYEKWGGNATTSVNSSDIN